MQLAGKIAQSFIQSKLTPIIVLASILLGAFAVIVTPREEEPQIIVPMLDVFVAYPGASAEEVERRVCSPMEKFLWEIEGVEYIYTTAAPEYGMAIVRFYVGSDMEKSIVNLYNKLMSNYDKIPPGVSQPLVKPRSINDVPIITLTLWSKNPAYTGYELRRIAAELCDNLKQDPDSRDITITGGQKRRITISLDPVKLRSYQTTTSRIMRVLESANYRLLSGSFPRDNEQFVVETGGFLSNAHDVGMIVVNVVDSKPVLLKDLADITDGPEEISNYVLNNFNPHEDKNSHQNTYEAVTISIAKKKGANATNLANRILEKTNLLKGVVIPSEVEILTTRNYGATAREKVDELLKHMLIAAVSVTVLIAIALGIRSSLIVLVAVPVTLALTIFIFYIYGYTLNRVTLFALIFSIGILVDDAIVVVENIHRHFVLYGVSIKTAVEAVDEVGNPTILATFAVIAALLPMAFVRGLMGPYMRPIPVGASAAMLISLLIAFVISPWLSYKVLKNATHNEHTRTEKKSLLDRLNLLYEQNLRWLLEHGSHRLIAILIVIALLFCAILLLPLKAVVVKMLPFDNKSEMQIIINTPEGTTLEQTAALAKEIGQYLASVPEVTSYQSYIGTSGPFNFNGLVRHYFLRKGPTVADIQVNLLPKEERKAQCHEIAKRIRPALMEIAGKYNARVKIVEMPPGPPVLSTLVAEIYGPDYDRQIYLAKQVIEIFKNTPGVVDVDWYIEADQKKIIYEVDKVKAAINGVSTEDVTAAIKVGLDGQIAGLAHFPDEKEPVELFLQIPLSKRSNTRDLTQLLVQGSQGNIVPVSELVNTKEQIIDKSIYHKNLKPVVYVLGEVAGTLESPVYAILQMQNDIRNLVTPDDGRLTQYFTAQPTVTTKYSLKWDGEWHITYEVFRDLGIAFAAVLILIYIMVVGWFKSFITPLVILAPIPLSLIGILPGHWLMGAFFTATSMIGFIAGAGIVVRNSIILVDFIELKMAEGIELKEAIVQAGIIRFRPMLLTASAVVVGSSVILLDPIFQGMAISLMAGEVAATLLSRTLVPVLYYMLKSKL